eukprot:14616-Heterococcus_DN1.PRE.1
MNPPPQNTLSNLLPTIALEDRRSTILNTSIMSLVESYLRGLAGFGSVLAATEYIQQQQIVDSEADAAIL